MSRRTRPLAVALALVAVSSFATAAHADTSDPVSPTPVPAEPVPGPPYDAVIDLTFPVDGPVSLGDSYHDPRGGGTRWHKAADLGGANAYGLPIHAAYGGTVTWITGLDGAAPHATAGYAITVSGDDGRRYSYMHLGRQDGPPTEAYAHGIVRGTRVQRGQRIGFLGYSGNASPSWPHLHFEIEDPRVTDPYGTHRMNPYPSLVAARERGDLPLDGRRFLDVPATLAHHDAIVWLADSGITSGCGARRYCPADQVTRGQLARFLASALALPPAANPTPFVDVPSTHTHADAIARVHAAGIARGAADGSYGPNRAVTREQMASLLTAARGDALTSASATPFSDVDPASVHAPAISALHHAGIVLGSNGAFRPAEPVTRAQMASFLQRSFSVPAA
ncbi:S-layer homology domain-containing protein [Egicoccus sp. AB-alg6-2]|uniref:S-layer homology domain-containing protein n=1 Tax=Egicoccus sp. AB-alg6-2 TaxID=3242692 RepID=UPI00359D62B5